MRKKTVRLKRHVYISRNSRVTACVEKKRAYIHADPSAGQRQSWPREISNAFISCRPHIYVQNLLGPQASLDEFSHLVT